MEGEGKVERGAAIRGGAMGEGVMWNNDGGRGGSPGLVTVFVDGRRTFSVGGGRCFVGGGRFRWVADVFGRRRTLFRGRYTFFVGGGRCFVGGGRRTSSSWAGDVVGGRWALDVVGGGRCSWAVDIVGGGRRSWAVDIVFVGGDVVCGRWTSVGGRFRGRWSSLV